MIEAGANEVPEDTMIEAIFEGMMSTRQIIAFIDKIVAEVGKPKHMRMKAVRFRKNFSQQ